MNTTLRFLILAFAFWSSGDVAWGQKPQPSNKVKARIVQHQAEVNTLNEKVLREIALAQRELLKAMEQQLRTLTQNKQLDEAIALRAALERLRLFKTEMELDQAIEEMKISPAAGIHDALVEYNRNSAAINRRTGKAIDLMNQKMIDFLSQNDSKQFPDLEAFRIEMLKTPNRDPADLVPRIPADPADASIVYHRADSVLDEAFKYRERHKVIELLAKLHPLQEQATVDGQFEMASLLNEFAERQTKQLNSLEISNFLKMNRGKLNDKISDTIKEYVLWNESEQKNLEKDHQELGRRYSRFELVEIKKGMLANEFSVENEFWTLQRYFRKLGKVPEWLKNSEAVPKSGRDEQKILNEFDQKKKKNLEAADQLDRRARDQLIESIAGLPKAPNEIAAQSRDRLVAFLGANYSVGLRGTMLLEVDPNLDDAAEKLVTAYRDSAQKMVDDFRRSIEKEFATCTEKLQRLRSQAIEVEEFERAYATRLSLQNMQPAIPPIWIRTGQFPFPSRPRNFFATEAMLLIEVKDDQFLVADPRNQFAPIRSFPRQQVFLSPDEFESKTPHESEREWDWRNVDPDKEISKADSSQLKPGQQITVWHQNEQKQLEVIDVSPFGPVVEVDFFGSKKSVVVPRQAIVAIK